MKYKTCLLALFAILAASPVSAHAGNSMLSFGAGDTGVFRNNNAADFRLEYRDGDPLFWQIRPFAGAEGTSKGAVYGLGGLLWDYGIAPHWYVTPSLGGGLYFHDGDRKLGSILEFRSQIEGAYEFDSRDRVSLALSHTENFGISSKNPGTEALTLYYHLPLNRLMGGDAQ